MTREESVARAAGQRRGASDGPPIKSAARVRLAIAVLAFGLGSSSAAGTVASMVGGEVPRLSLHGETPDQREMVYKVVDGYVSAGLELPPLTITFGRSRDDCDGLAGRHRHVGEIEVCIPTPYMIAHEIAHAWDVHSLTDADREAYRQLWDAPTWGSHDFEWHERAKELAANTVAFGVLNDEQEPFAQILMYLCTFEALTGRPLPTPVISQCPPIRHPGVGSASSHAVASVVEGGQTREAPGSARIRIETL